MRPIDLFSSFDDEIIDNEITEEKDENGITIIDGLQMAKDNMTEYALYVGQGRAYPQMIDGCKSSYKRAIYGMYKEGGSKKQKVAELAAYALPYHPHPTSVSGVIVQLGEFGNKLSLMDTQGNWGDSSRNIQASADRYIEGKLSDVAKNLLCDSIDYCEYVKGEIDNDEPKALPALIPLCFINGQEGIPAGLPKLNIPCLNISDMFDYYLDILKHKDLNYIPKIIPSLNTGLDIISDINDWNNVIKTGYGSVRLAPKMTLEDNVITITSLPTSKNCETVCKILEKEILQDKIDVRDESAKDIRIVIEKVYRKSCDMQEIYDKLYRKLQISQTYNMCFFMDDKIYTPCSFDKVVKENIKYIIATHKNRIKNELEDNKNRLAILELIEKMKPNIKNIFDKDFDSAISYISSKYKVTDEISKSALQKPMSYLTKAHQNEIDDLKNKITELENDNSDIWTFLLNKYKKLKKDVTSEIKAQKDR